MSASIRSITAPRGFRAAAWTCGVKQSHNPDLALIVADGLCAAAAVFTQTTVPSPSVVLGRQHVRRGKLRAIVCNSGVSNAYTGTAGYEDARTLCAAVAEHLGCRPNQVLSCSTGVTGVRLPMEKILAGLEPVVQRLNASPRADADAAKAIMTTDLTPKAAVRDLQIGGATVTLAGIAKGSGMIAPSMATMLAFITTDAAISTPLLRAALKAAVNAPASFNRISVDTDMSPSDTLAIMASGLAGNRAISARGAAYQQFADALTDLCRDLAYQVIADGEGATKVIRVRVQGARTDSDAVRIGRSVVDSPLVKTAIHGADPNWGRILAAVGKSGATVKPESLTVRIGSLVVSSGGQPAAADRMALASLMREREVVITIDAGLGKGESEWLGCDLSREYITINADYHT